METKASVESMMCMCVCVCAGYQMLVIFLLVVTVYPKVGKHSLSLRLLNELFT